MRRYKIVRLVENRVDRWMVISISLRDDETWDVIAAFDTRDEAFTYRDMVMARSARLVAEAY